MEVSITARPDASAAIDRLHLTLAGIAQRTIACSGGIDSLVLAVVAHRSDPTATTIAHTITPAVPAEATRRVLAYADRERWDLHTVHSDEFEDEAYVSNPVDRCYHCKHHLYRAVEEAIDLRTGGEVLSGANLDDLGEYRPGLVAADEHAVRHPYVEAQITKSEVRAIARHLGLEHAELPAAPCLASRLYTGTRVTPSRLRAVEAGEALVRSRTGIGVVRCRVDESSVFVEVHDDDRRSVTDDLLAAVARTMVAIEPSISTVALDPRSYAPGRAVRSVARPRHSHSAYDATAPSPVLDGSHDGRADR